MKVALFHTFYLVVTTLMECLQCIFWQPMLPGINNLLLSGRTKNSLIYCCSEPFEVVNMSGINRVVIVLSEGECVRESCL